MSDKDRERKKNIPQIITIKEKIGLNHLINHVNEFKNVNIKIKTFLNILKALRIFFIFLKYKKVEGKNTFERFSNFFLEM